MNYSHRGVVSPDQGVSGLHNGSETEEAMETDGPDYKGVTALSNPIFRNALDSDPNTVLCIENFFAITHQNGSGRRPANPITPASSLSASTKRKARAKTSQTSPSHFTFKLVERRKVSLDLVAQITDDDGGGKMREYKAIALAVDNTSALVSLNIDGSGYRRLATLTHYQER